ncbi:excinuclease ABC subunit UvrC [Polyangium sorediatum]|uniref:UvrABC system protein C n=1 Tax=Polyangium sorediatum TaxID=889274 RepID=A0ABT6P3Q2_9BACT|nr:excinuclease ABC subunit UvrC [Polyangium sorediatum]MDI1434870.1 excinuclease ABC subunit UvrC [Polyangium sorediatum]
MSDDARAPEPETDPVLAKLDTLPTKPGCYLFYDKTGATIYVGKAKSLRSRVRSYFQEGGSDSRYFIPILRKIVRDLETVVTSTEKEAAVLENELIKKHKPRFNVKLRDDKDFLCLRIDTKAAWPRLETVRRPSPDGARYFGPFHSATSARRTLHLVNKHWKLRTCTDLDMASRRRPCLQYQIKRCPAPCVYEVDRDEYAEQVRSVSLFLEGRHDELTGELEKRMKEAARSMEFERAAIYRDQLKAVEIARESQRVVSVKDVDQDVVGLYREGSIAEVELIKVRSGRVADTVSFSLRGVELPDEEILGNFLTQYYGDEAEVPVDVIPDEILLPVLPDGAEGVSEWLGDRRGRKVALVVPQRGPRVELLAMARENAEHAFKEKQRASDDIEARLDDLRERLRLPSLPRRIECCDISHLGGGDTVGSIVALRDGQPDRKHYRNFRVRTKTEGDDYAAMYEVLARRFRRGRTAREVKEAEAAAEAAAEVAAEAAAEAELATETEIEVAVDAMAEPETETEPETEAPPPSSGKKAEAEWDLPDLFVVDGGRGQLNVALSAARDLGLHDLPIVGLAKERESVIGEKMVDRVYLPGQKNGILLRPGSSSLFFLARARDEAHRFANHIREKLGKARRLRSEIEDIAGLGDAVRKALLRELGSMGALRTATDAQILAVTGVTKRHLTAIRKVIAAPGEAAAPAPAAAPTPPPAEEAMPAEERKDEA